MYSKKDINNWFADHFIISIDKGHYVSTPTWFPHVPTETLQITHLLAILERPQKHMAIYGLALRHIPIRQSLGKRLIEKASHIVDQLEKPWALNAQQARCTFCRNHHSVHKEPPK